jgi:hypothetical protein
MASTLPPCRQPAALLFVDQLPIAGVVIPDGGERRAATYLLLISSLAWNQRKTSLGVVVCQERMKWRYGIDSVPTCFRTTENVRVGGTLRISYGVFDRVWIREEVIDSTVDDQTDEIGFIVVRAYDRSQKSINRLFHCGFEISKTRKMLSNMRLA